MKFFVTRAWRIVVSVAALSVVNGAAVAQQERPPAVRLAAAVEAAWQRAVSARDATGQQLRAEAERSVAASLSAGSPALELSHRDDRLHSSLGRRESEIGVAWPLWLPGQRSAKSEAAEADVAASEAAIKAARLRLAGEVRDAAWAVVIQSAEAAQADAQAQQVRRVADDVDRRVRAGDLARTDAMAAKAELLAAEALQSELRQKLSLSRSRWTVLTGLGELPDPAEELDGPADSATADVDAHPELRAARLAAERARKRLDLTRMSRRDPPELALRWTNESPGRGERAQSTVGIGIRVPIGTAGRNQPLEVAAMAEADVAAANERQLRARLSAERTDAIGGVRAAEQQLEAERQRAELLRQRAALLEKSFTAGETGLPDLLRALAAASHAESAVVRQQGTLGLARARLNQARGLMP